LPPAAQRHVRQGRAILRTLDAAHGDTQSTAADAAAKDCARAWRHYERAAQRLVDEDHHPSDADPGACLLADEVAEAVALSPSAHRWPRLGLARLAASLAETCLRRAEHRRSVLSSSSLFSGEGGRADDDPQHHQSLRLRSVPGPTHNAARTRVAVAHAMVGLKLLQRSDAAGATVALERSLAFGTTGFSHVPVHGPGAALHHYGEDDAFRASVRRYRRLACEVLSTAADAFGSIFDDHHAAVDALRACLALLDVDRGVSSQSAAAAEGVVVVVPDDDDDDDDSEDDDLALESTVRAALARSLRAAGEPNAAIAALADVVVDSSAHPHAAAALEATLEAWRSESNATRSSDAQRRRQRAVPSTKRGRLFLELRWSARVEDPPAPTQTSPFVGSAYFNSSSSSGAHLVDWALRACDPLERDAQLGRRVDVLGDALQERCAQAWGYRGRYEADFAAALLGDDLVSPNEEELPRRQPFDRFLRDHDDDASSSSSSSEHVLDEDGYHLRRSVFSAIPEQPLAESARLAAETADLRILQHLRDVALIVSDDARRDALEARLHAVYEGSSGGGATAADTSEEAEPAASTAVYRAAWARAHDRRRDAAEARDLATLVERRRRRGGTRRGEL